MLTGPILRQLGSCPGLCHLLSSANDLSACLAASRSSNSGNRNQGMLFISIILTFFPLGQLAIIYIHFLDTSV
jgi:hypothetical protein